MPISFIQAAENGVANGGNPTLTFASTSVQAGDVVVVAYAVPRTLTMNVTSSSTGTAYTQCVTTLTNGNLNFSVWYRVIGASEVQAICTGTGNAQDGDTAVGFAFRGVDTTNPLDVTATSTTGTGTTPQSPAITPATPLNNIVISAVGSLVSDTTVTAPSSWLNQTDVDAVDTRSTTTGMCWLSYSSTTALTPASWTNFTSAAWASATIALKEQIFPLPSQWQHTMFNRTEMIGY